MTMSDVSTSQAIQLWCAHSGERDLIARARSAAATAQSVGQAFAIGVQAAIAHLTRNRYSDSLCAVAVSEDTGIHPRQMQCTLSAGQVLQGHKSFVTLGKSARVLLVLARDPEGVLRIASLLREQPRVQVRPLPALDFVPDLPHARLEFQGAHVCEVLDGDGYSDFAKPFRVYEDLYARLTVCELGRKLVAAAGLEAPPNLLSARAGLADSIGSFDGTGAAAIAVESSLAAADEALRHLQSVLPPQFRTEWIRDLRLLDIGASARAARLQKALRNSS